MSEATFHIKLLKNYQLVTKPGTYYVSVGYNVTDANLFCGEGVDPKYIVPLRAITGEGLNQIIEALKEDATGQVPFSAVRHCFLSGALWCGEDDLYEEEDLPIKGERVLANFDNVETDSGIRLLCTTLQLLPREELDYIDPNLLDQFRLAITNLITKST